MSNFVTKAGRVAAFAHSARNVDALYKYKRILEEMPDKTDLEMNALKGLKYSLICKWIVAIITVIGICWGIWLKG